jgi:predicted nucleic acid-binding protein
VITHLLDSSAILAHYLDEPGGREVNDLLGQSEAIALSVVSFPEIKIRLLELVSDASEAERVFKLYSEDLTTPIEVSKEVAEAATRLRELVRPRLPTIHALIAACAKVHNAVLVHRDPHMSAIPTDEVRQLILPLKTVPPA